MASFADKKPQWVETTVQFNSRNKYINEDKVTDVNVTVKSCYFYTLTNLTIALPELLALQKQNKTCRLMFHIFYQLTSEQLYQMPTTIWALWFSPLIWKISPYIISINAVSVYYSRATPSIPCKDYPPASSITILRPFRPRRWHVTNSSLHEQKFSTPPRQLEGTDETLLAILSVILFQKLKMKDAFSISPKNTEEKTFSLIL